MDEIIILLKSKRDFPVKKLQLSPTCTGSLFLFQNCYWPLNWWSNFWHATSNTIKNCDNDMNQLSRDFELGRTLLAIYFTDLMLF